MFLLTSTACLRKAPPSRLIIVLIDVSASIEPEAQQSAFQAIEDILPTLRRGDSLVVIPITGDAGNDSQGRIIRLTLAERREAYDQDLRRAAANLRHSLEETKAATLRTPGAHTDILGALQLAEEEIRLAGEGRNKMLILLSDMIQDDDELNFRHDIALRNAVSAASLATTSPRSASLRFQETPIFIGFLRSRDRARLSPQRRTAIDIFWLMFLKNCGANPHLAKDGPGLALLFLSTETHGTIPRP
jgi:hypothetical protein